LVAAIVCVALRPSDVLSYDGLSFYGNFRETLLPYGLGLVATSYFLLRACLTLVDSQVARSFRAGLEIIAIALLGIVATPSFSYLWFVQDLHVVFGLVIFIAQAVLSLNYLRHAEHTTFDTILLTLQVLAIVVAALSLHEIHALSLMLPAQLLAVVAFDTLLLRAVHAETKRPVRA